MREGRVIAVLLAIILLFSVILGIKILNNTPEKQMEKIVQEYSAQENETTMDKNEKVKELFGAFAIYQIISLTIIGIFFVVVLLLIISNYKIYFKLGLDSNLIWSSIILLIASIVPILGWLCAIASLVINIILIVQEYKVLGLNPLVLLLCLIPFLGMICVFVLFIIVTLRLADYFGRGRGFKLGLIFFPVIFYPILAFSGESESINNL